MATSLFAAAADTLIEEARERLSDISNEYGERKKERKTPKRGFQGVGVLCTPHHKKARVSRRIGRWSRTARSGSGSGPSSSAEAWTFTQCCNNERSPNNVPHVATWQRGYYLPSLTNAAIAYLRSPLSYTSIRTIRSTQAVAASLGSDAVMSP